MDKWSLVMIIGRLNSAIIATIVNLIIIMENKIVSNTSLMYGSSNG